MWWDEGIVPARGSVRLSDQDRIGSAQQGGKVAHLGFPAGRVLAEECLRVPPDEREVAAVLSRAAPAASRRRWRPTSGWWADRRSDTKPESPTKAPLPVDADRDVIVSEVATGVRVVPSWEQLVGLE